MGVAVLILSLSIKPLLVFLTKERIRSVFTGSSVSIDSCHFYPLRMLAFSGIEIKNVDNYTFKIKQIKIEYTIPKIIQAHISKVSLEGVDARVNMADKKLEELRGYYKVNGKAALSIDSIGVWDLKLDIRAAGLVLNADISSELNIAWQKVDRLNAQIHNFTMQDMKLQDLKLTLALNAPQGSLYARQVQYNKIDVHEINAQWRLSGKEVVVHSLSAKIFKGMLRAEGALTFSYAPVFHLKVDVYDLDVENMIEVFKLAEKFRMSGQLGGSIQVEGSGRDMKVVGGNFFLSEPGGNLLIKDKKFLENIVRSSRQSLDILVESFRNYRYNTGKVNVSYEAGDLRLSLGLEGEAGQRNLDIVWHDFSLGGMLK